LNILISMKFLFGSIRVIAATLLVCCAGYGLVILAVAQAITPAVAEGQLVRNSQGDVIGSLQVAQAFSSPRYFWPRPSAVDYNAAAAGGSNLSPTNPKLAKRAKETIAHYTATADHPLPPDLAAASGSGLDPHISLAAAKYQIPRIAAARGVAPSQIEALVDHLAFRPGGILTPDRVVNVLQLNLELNNMP
jgi:K+-transporting ATPase ATPase C chain